MTALALRAVAEPPRAALDPDDPAVCGRHAPQLRFVRDPSRYKVACCSRRAGKTFACAFILLLSALEHAGSENLYVTLSRVTGKRIVWKKLLELNRKHALGGHPDRSELTLTFPNGSVIFVGGIPDEAKIEKWRGNPWQTVVVDEAQAIKEFVREFVDDVVEPVMIETKGTIVLIGTPGKVRAGYFYEACRSASPELAEALNLHPANDNGGGGEEDEERDEDGAVAEAEWSVHHWTIADNPFIRDVAAELARLRKRRRWSAEHPTYQREYLGRWVVAHEALVYHYDPGRNGYDPARLPAAMWAGPEWKFVHFADVGVDDADAVGTLAYRRDEPWLWLLPDEVVVREQGSAQLVIEMKRRWEQYKGRSVGFVIDPAGGGKKSALDAQDKGVPVESAEKRDKVAGIDLVNDDLVAGVLRIPLDSQAAADAARVTWDPKARGIKIAGRYHTDIWDGIVYGRRKVPPGAIISLAEYRARVEAKKDVAAVAQAETQARIAERQRLREQAKGRRGNVRNLLR